MARSRTREGVKRARRAVSEIPVSDLAGGKEHSLKGQIAKAARCAREQHKIVIFTVPAIRKRGGTAPLERTVRGPKVVFCCSASTSMWGLIRGLIRLFNISRGSGRSSLSGHELFELLGPRLGESDALLIVESADRLTDRALELLRDFYDSYHASILLVGDKSLLGRIDRRLERLASRAVRWPVAGDANVVG